MKGIRFLAGTILALVLAVVFQTITSDYIADSLINALLASAAVLVGAWSGIIVGVFAPVAVLFQQNVEFPWLIPIIAGGNVVFALIYGWCYGRSKIFAVALASVFKFLFLYFLVSMAVEMLVVPQPAAGVLSIRFGWSQLVTAIIGGLIALPAIKKILSN